MSTLAFIATLLVVIGLALLIRRSRFALPITFALAAVLVASLLLLTLGVKPAGWVAMVSTTLIVFTLFPHGSLGSH